MPKREKSLEENYDEIKIKFLNRIALIHKVYGWIVIVLSLLIAILIQGPYCMGEVSKLFTISVLVASIIAFLFALFNLVVAKALKKRNRYAIYMSSFAILFMVFFRGTLIDLLFAGLLLILWVFYFKAIKYPSVGYVRFFLYVLPAPALIGAYFLFTMSVHEKAEDLCSTVIIAKPTDIDYVKRKLDSGFDPNLENSDGRTALFCTVYPEIAELLLDYGADINHQDNDGDTALHDIFQPDLASVKYIEVFLTHNPDVTLKNNQGLTAMDLVRHEYEKISNDKLVSEEDQIRLKKIYDLLSSYTKHAKGITKQSSQ